jgi:hypothetical protein
MDRNDLWLAFVKDHPGRTAEELVADMRAVPQLFRDLFSSWPLAWRLLRDRLLGETDFEALRSELHRFESVGYVHRRERQVRGQAQAEHDWVITEAGQTYLRGRGIR